MGRDDGAGSRARWARLRFSIIGPLLASPPKRGELRGCLEELAKRTWQHPTTGQPLRFGASTIERWYYAAREADDPVEALVRKTHGRAGKRPTMGVALRAALRAQYEVHKSWSYKLHHDNLVALAKQQPSLGEVPSYATVTRFMKEQGLIKRRRRKKKTLDDGADTFIPRERRSFEMEHVHALWHADFHVGSRRVLTRGGDYQRVYLLAFLDDHSRLCCHLQWYLAESAETFVHGLCQAILKRGLPRALMTDNGSAMRAAETTEGLTRCGITHKLTLEYSPEQNAKAEAFWGQGEGRLMAMLENEKPLTLPVLNHATIAWAEQEYQRGNHSELGTSPLTRALTSPSVSRRSPSADVLRRRFRAQERRTQRRSDGTLTIDGIRFELPSRYRTIIRPTVRFARWDLSSVDLIDPRSDTILCALYPLDKNKNADGRRRSLESVTVETPSAPTGIAPHLTQLMADYDARGLPPAYLPLGDEPHQKDDDES